MKVEILVHQHTCDGCGKVSTTEPDGELPMGYHLTATHIHFGGGDGANDIFACSERCIRKAVVSALTERGRS